jgi:hypothetical protein
LLIPNRDKRIIRPGQAGQIQIKIQLDRETVMSEAGSRALPTPHIMFRFLSGKKRPIFIPRQDHRRQRKRPSSSALHLVSHMGTTTLVFLALTAFAWAASFALRSLDSLVPFPANVLLLLERLKMGLIYVDVVICGLASLTGIGHFIVNILKGES